jgi:hypothetical protein
MLLKVAKLTIEEGRTKSAQQESAAGHVLDRFTGDAEAIPIPSVLSASERETVRALLGILARPTRAKVLDAVARNEATPATTPTADAGSANGPASAVSEVDDGDALPSDPVPPRPSTPPSRRRAFDHDLGF